MRKVFILGLFDSPPVKKGIKKHIGHIKLILLSTYGYIKDAYNIAFRGFGGLTIQKDFGFYLFFGGSLREISSVHYYGHFYIYLYLFLLI